MAPIDAPLDEILSRLDKLDSLEAKVDEFNRKVSDLSTSVNTLKSEVDVNTAAIAEIRKEMAADKKEIRSLKEQLNYREQLSRGSTVRIFNLPPVRGESVNNYQGLASRVYDKIIRPCLVAAKNGGDIATVPQIQNCVDACYRVFSPTEPEPGSTPMPVVVRLASPNIKIAVMKHRRAIPPGEVGSLRILVVEDLTPPTHKLLKELQKDSRTAKVWSLNGRICYKLVDQPESVKRVKSVFATVAEILGP